MSQAEGVFFNQTSNHLLVELDQGRPRGMGRGSGGGPGFNKGGMMRGGMLGGNNRFNSVERPPLKEP